MSKKEEKIAQYQKAASDLKLDIDEGLIAKVTDGLGPSIYNRDAETVSCSDSSELQRVRENFLKKKLGLEEDNKILDAAIKEVCERLGSSNRNKYRALFYALLVKKFGKEALYA
ncbi:DUF2853 family protein [Nitratifractor sp.]|uniref:DUF2853 family protein n=1 Tax=Nitratifractor sp. TaxID=2268144 RepID=UPI0025D99E1F|nr:DUF2853 family protein [Nitratifractor sp.]